MAILLITVDGASYDEPDVMAVPNTPEVRAAIRSWQSTCDFYLDGSVTVEERQPEDDLLVMSVVEFLEHAAQCIGADADEIAELPRLWRAGREWRRE